MKTTKSTYEIEHTLHNGKTIVFTVVATAINDKQTNFKVYVPSTFVPLADVTYQQKSSATNAERVLNLYMANRI